MGWQAIRFIETNCVKALQILSNKTPYQLSSLRSERLWRVEAPNKRYHSPSIPTGGVTSREVLAVAPLIILGDERYNQSIKTKTPKLESKRLKFMVSRLLYTVPVVYQNRSWITFNLELSKTFSPTIKLRWEQQGGGSFDKTPSVV